MYELLVQQKKIPSLCVCVYMCVCVHVCVCVCVCVSVCVCAFMYTVYSLLVSCT